jgi:hypothetical protein
MINTLFLNEKRPQSNLKLFWNVYFKFEINQFKTLKFKNIKYFATLFLLFFNIMLFQGFIFFLNNLKYTTFIFPNMSIRAKINKH